MTGQTVDRTVAAIELMDLEQLRSLWGTRYGAPPGLRSVPIMRLILSWRVQAEALGGLEQEVLAKLRQTGAPEPEGSHLGVGARLSRTWNGRRVEVIVEERGFRWEDEVYPSLSAAATAIAGSRWNGPRFFGLRNARER